MTTSQKLSLAREAESFPLRLRLSVLNLPRSTWYYHSPPRPTYAHRHEGLRPLLEEIAREHPEYGYRRTAVELRETHDRVVNRKVVQKLHRMWGLPLLRSTRTPRPSGVRRVVMEVGERANRVAKLDGIEPFQVLYTDFTELVYAGGERKAYLIAFPDHASKLVLGWSVGDRAIVALALEGWQRVVGLLAKNGLSPKNVIVHHDRDPVFTSYGWTGQLLLKDQAQVSYALGGAQDNPEMESFFGRFKTENRSLLQDAADLPALRQVVDERMLYFNQERRHSALGYRSPLRYLADRGLRLESSP